MQYLRKHGTGRVYPRTKILARRPDMRPITEEEAMKLIAAENARHVVNSKELDKADQAIADAEAREREDIDDAPTPTEEPPSAIDVAIASLDGMNREALESKAAELKITVHPASKDDTLRKKIAATLAADAEE